MDLGRLYCVSFPSGDKFIHRSLTKLRIIHEEVKLDKNALRNFVWLISFDGNNLIKEKALTILGTEINQLSGRIGKMEIDRVMITSDSSQLLRIDRHLFKLLKSYKEIIHLTREGDCFIVDLENENLN